MKRPHPNTGNDSGKKQRTETDVIVLDPPSPPTMVSLSPGASNMNEDSKIYPNTSNMVSDLPNIETSSPNKVTQEVDRIVNDCKMVNIDKDVVDEIKTMSPKQQLQALLTRSQKLKHLYALRANVYKLLKVLVPELEVGNDLKQKYDDQTVDELLTQVLEQAEKSDS